MRPYIYIYVYVYVYVYVGSRRILVAVTGLPDVARVLCHLLLVVGLLWCFRWSDDGDWCVESFHTVLVNLFCRVFIPVAIIDLLFIKSYQACLRFILFLLFYWLACLSSILILLTYFLYSIVMYFYKLFLFMLIISDILYTYNLIFTHNLRKTFKELKRYFKNTVVFNFCIHTIIVYFVFIYIQ